MRPLDGLRVVDLTTFLAGPLATRSLADLGADVMKVEPPTGDPTRAGWTGTDGTGAPSYYWRALHGGRRSVVFDLATPQGREAFIGLASAADVVVENLRPGVSRRFGIDGPALRARFPRLVTCAITGFDEDDELSGISATDGPVQASAGVVELMQRWSGVSLPVPIQVGDIAGGALATQGILAALVARAGSGVGTHVQVSLAGALAQWMAVTDRQATLAPPATMVLTGSDGARFLVQAPLRFAAGVLTVFGLASNTPRAEIAAAAEAAAVEAPASSWLDRLWAAGIPAAPLRPLSSELPRPPWSFDGARLDPAGAPPALGADNGRGWA